MADLTAQALLDLPQEEMAKAVSALSQPQLDAAKTWKFWQRGDQCEPAGDWRVWLVMAGRGYGKTRMGAEWAREKAENEAGVRIALIGATMGEARSVMVEGESGLLSLEHAATPEWKSSLGQLKWPNGSVATLYSAAEPEGLRGPQHDYAWADEIAKWTNGDVAWDNLMLGLRLGAVPQAMATTTPRPVPLVRRLVKEKGVATTSGKTSDNAAGLAPAFIGSVRDLYDGTRLGRQELDGVLIEEAEGALWTPAGLEATRVRELPEMSRIVVAVDPPVSGTERSDACGIVVAGVVAQGPVQDWRAYILEDVTVQGASPMAWAEAAVSAMHRWKAERMVAEVNQGGDLVEQVIRQVDPLISLRKVHASKGKAARAEPIAALYEQGRVHHFTGLAALEEEMCQLTMHGFHGKGSPDRTDALVWALTELMILPAKSHMSPQVRTL